MSSIWTNLLFLHGHITPTDLPWRKDAAPDQYQCGSSLKLTPVVRSDVSAPPARPTHGDAPACA